MYTVAALYQFADLKDFEALQGPLKKMCDDHGVKGTLLLASEGINGTIAGTREGIDAVKAFIESHPLLNNLEYKESFAEEMPFYRMKVRLKQEIVTLGKPEAKPSEMVGTYVEPADWNALLNDPETLLIDTRNDYEFGVGTFKGAINPETETFRAFPEYVEKHFDPKKHKKVAMFCTGGIRCEKASAYMLKQGFENVYHLKGGILKYLENMPQEKSLWEGDCFVFDERVAVGHGLALSDYTLCRACRHPLSEEDRTHKSYVEGSQCAYCEDKLTEKQRKAAIARHNQVLLAEKRGQKHIGS